jgi:GT2 family glycosyltransferase
MISIVICSIDPEKFAAVSGNYARLLGAEPFEIIGIHDARSLSEGYNRGIAQSSGDILILSHDDIEIISPEFRASLKRHLQDYDLIGVAGTTRVVMHGSWISAGQPYVQGHVIHIDPDNREYIVNVYGAGATVVPDIQALDGLFMAMRRQVAETLKFDEAAFDGFHLYDMDFSYSAYLSGYRLAVCNDISIIHASTGNFGSSWEAYQQRFLEKFRARITPNETPKIRVAMARYKSKESVLNHCTPARLAEVSLRLLA